MKKAKQIFYAISTTGGANYQPYGVAKNRKVAQAQAMDLLRGRDIVDRTLRQNIEIVSRTTAIRRGIIARDTTVEWDQDTQSYRWEN